MKERRVYLLRERDYSPETIAVAFAKTSRSPESFQEIADGLSDAQSADFHEKWVVGYGHASVAEHAVLHLAIENVSRLAVETIESNRLASYTEKSTRYQKWDADAFHLPAEAVQAGLGPDFEAAAEGLFSAYRAALPRCQAVVERQLPCRSDESEAAWERRIRSKFVDVCRFLLPAASLANLGMTANARVLEGMVRKMLSSPLAEVRAAGAQVKAAAAAEVPTLLKYADESAYLVETPRGLAESARSIEPGKGEGDWCRLVDWQADGEVRALAAALYRFSGGDYQAMLSRARGMEEGERARVFDLLLGSAGRFDTPLRELEHVAYTFDLVLDQGAYFEVKRHRMMTQTAQELTADLGYAVPALLQEAGSLDDYRRAMDAAGEAYRRFRPVLGPAAAYIIPNGYKRRMLLSMNFREAYTFCALRSAANAHFSVRRVAQRIAEEIRRVHPLLGSYLRPNPEETWHGVEAAHFIQA